MNYNTNFRKLNPWEYTLEVSQPGNDHTVQVLTEEGWEPVYTERLSMFETYRTKRIIEEGRCPSCRDVLHNGLWPYGYRLYCKSCGIHSIDWEPFVSEETLRAQIKTFDLFVNPILRSMFTEAERYAWIWAKVSLPFNKYIKWMTVEECASTSIQLKKLITKYSESNQSDQPDKIIYAEHVEAR